MKITTSFAFLAAASALALGSAQEPQPQQPSTNLRKGGQQGQAQGKGRSVACLWRRIFLIVRTVRMESGLIQAQLGWFDLEIN